LKTQLDQYTDLSEEDSAKIESRIPENTMREFRSVYIETAQRLKSQQGKSDKGVSLDINQLDFEFVLFSSAIIDYDYIMTLISKYTQAKPSKQKMNANSW